MPDQRFSTDWRAWSDLEFAERYVKAIQAGVSVPLAASSHAIKILSKPTFRPHPVTRMHRAEYANRLKRNRKVLDGQDALITAGLDARECGMAMRRRLKTLEAIERNNQMIQEIEGQHR